MARSSSSHAKTFLPRQQRRHLRPRRSPKKRVDATVLCPGALQNLSSAQPEHLPPRMDLPRHAGDKTLAVHAGEKLGRCWGTDTDSIVTPVVGGTTHWFKNSEDLIAFKEGRRHSHEYGRYSNPTVKVLEDKISSLERAEVTLVTSSGMNAIVVTLLALVPPGSHVVTTIDCYSEARAFVRDRLGKMGIKSTFIDLDDMEKLKAVLETSGALVCIDSTMASPINQKPLTLGADIVLHSATKYMAGHHDVIAGCISGSEALISRIRRWHHNLGGTISPNAAYMIIRGLKTMALRVETQNSTALRMARLLECHPKIVLVHYPGMNSSPWHQVARVQMDGYGGVISFETKSDLCGTMRFVDALEIPFIATSLGGCESLVQQPAVMSFWGQTDEEKSRNGIKDNLVRFSFGIEKFEDLRDDILQALEKI
ncbi:unnamed protein product [Urochloa decumbens]|uniref:Uncharacterized protein n=1 Tax=Urochloa decumbens TaxID=240449 RepID=A0ABC9H2A2_9POAL